MGFEFAQNAGGALFIATSQATSSATYTTLATPDQVTGVVLPTNGLIAVWYQATWQATTNTGGAAAIFLGATQVDIAGAGLAAAYGQAAGISLGNSNIDKPLTSYGGGLQAPGNTTTPYTGDVSTGQIVGVDNGLGGPCYIFATAGTYTVSVQFKGLLGATVTAKNRRLKVKVI